VKQNVKKNGREKGLTDKDVARKFAKGRGRANESYGKELKYPRN